MQRAYNPETNEYLFLVNNEWVKPSQKAANPQTGDLAFLVNNQWEIVTPPAKPAVAKPAAPAVPDLNTFAGLDVPVAPPAAAPTAIAAAPAAPASAEAARPPEMTEWNPTLYERFLGLFPSNRDRASAELAARRIAAEKNIPVDQVYRDVLGSRPLINPEGRPAVQAAVQATQKLAQEAPRIGPGFANAMLRAYRAGDIAGPEAEGFVDQLIASTERPKPSALRDKNYEALEGAGDSLGYSLATMVPTILAGVSTGLFTANPLAATAAGAGASGATAYRASKDEFLSRVLEKLNDNSQKIYGRSITNKEWSEAKKEYEDAAVRYGAWEAIPEAVSNVIFLKAFTAPVKTLRGAKLISAAEKAASVATENATETITALGQNREELRSGLTTEELGVADAFRQQFLQTMVTMGVMAGGAKTSQLAKDFYINKVEPRVAPGSALARAIDADLRAMAIDPRAAEKQYMRRTTKVGEEAAAPPTTYAPPVEKPVAVAQPPVVVPPPEAPEAEGTEAIPGMVSAADLAQETPAPEAAPEVATPAPSAAAPAAPTTTAAPEAQPETKPLEVFKSPTDNMQSRIVQLQDGRYSVTLQDLDSGETFPNARIFKTLEPAQEYARRIANLPAAAPAAETPAAAAIPTAPAAPPAIKQPEPQEPPAAQHEAQGLPTQEVPIKSLTLSKDVPQFKIGASEKGVVEPLGGKFERTGVAPIQVWRRLDGSLEVISGRHRFDLAQRSGEKTIPAQIHDEAKGFDRVQAAILDAELNIRDGQGKVKDYVNYFKESGIDRDTAESKGLLARATGKRSFTIANQGSDDLIAAVRADQIGDEAAYYIALNAPNDARLQAVGLKAIADGKSMNMAVNTMQAIKALAGESDTSIDMFGFDDSAMRAAEDMAKAAASKQREIQTRLSAISGAAKNPAIAKAEGIDVKDPAAVQRRIDELKQLKSAWDTWSTSPELVAELRAELKPSFALAGETEEERRAREAAAPAEQLKAEEKEIADRERDMFQLQEQKAEPEAPTEPDMFSQGMARTTEETTAEDRKYAQSHADDLGGVVVWQQGEYALVRGYGKLTGKPIYLPTIGSSRAKVDVESFTGSQIPASIKKQMIAEKNRLEKESQEAFEKDPFIIFDDGIAISKDIPEDLAGVIRGWKDLILPDARIYVSTIEDANKNKNKFNGPHRVIGSGTLDARNAGSMRRMEDGSYYILFSKSTSKTNMLETIAHEMGHVHEREYFEKATPEERAALIEAHAQWLKRQRGQTAKTLVENLRAHTTGKTTIVPAGKMADDLTPYWRSFGEWYADQTARWATSAKTPTTIVEKFFKRLGVALRKFYQSLKAQKYLPDETFAKYIEKTISRPIEVDTSLMPSIQNGLDFYSESQMTKEISDANPDSKSLHAAAELPGAKKKLPPGRSPELAAAAKMVQEGTMTTAEYDKLVNKFKPIYVYTEPLKPATEAQMVDALDSSKRDKVNPNIPSGHQVGLRLDIPAFNRKGVYVVTIHEKGTKSGPGKAIGYSSVAKVTNATFGLGNQKAALKIATGEAKDALQTVEGTYTKITPEEASAQAQQVLDDPSWTQIGLDPTRHSYFYDRYTSIPVIAAEEVLQIGNMVLGKNVTYGKKADFLYNIDSTPPQTKQQRITARQQMRNEKIAELAKLRLREFHLYKRMREYGSTIETQRLSNELNGLTRELKLDLDFLKTPIITPENFLNQARNALEGNLPYKGRAISPEVFAVIRDAYQKTPWLLSGLRLSIKKPKKGEPRAAGNFAPLQRIVTLWSGTTGTEEPTTIRHELTHSMEQMMTPAQQKVVIEAWRDALGRAIKKHTDAESQKYFVKVLEFLNNPNAESFQDALDALPSYDLYQYINPSEFWAVNAEKLLAQHLGGAWDKFKKAMVRLFEGLKNILGFNNKYAVHKVFEDIVKGQHQRLSRSSLAGIIVGSGYSMNKLENLGDDERMLRKYNRPNTPQLDTSPMLNAIKRSGAFTKDLFKDAVSSPLVASEMMMNGVLRGITYVRNKNVWFGSGLNAADFKNYNGALRTSEGFVTGSVALDNAIRGAQLSTEVIFRGGIKYDPKTLTFNAVKTEKGMAGVYKAEMKLKKVLGDQVGTDLIQAYLEAKRSRSIQNELYKRTKDYEDLKDALVKLKSQGAPDPKQVKELTTLMEEAQEDLDSIKVAHAKINMTDEEIDDFIARDKVHKELRDIMENWTAINQNMLKFWRQVGLLSEGRYKTLSSIEDYVPWNRIMDDAADVHSPLQSTTRKMTNIGLEKLFKRGKPTVITDFVVEPGQKKFKIQPASVVKAKINGKDVPADKMDITPDGEVTIHAPLRAGDLVVFTTNREIENVIDNMTRNVMRMTMNGLRQYAAMRIVQEYATRDPKGKIMVYPKVDPAKGRFNFIANGKRIVVEISDPLIAESIFGMETLGLKTIPILAALANLTRRTITLSGAFQIKQVFKDAPTAAIVTGVKNPAFLLGGVYKGFFTSLTKTDPVVDILHAAGIAGFRSPTRTPEAEIKQRLGVMNRNIASFVIRGLDHIGDASDMAQRVATYKRVLAETGDEAQALYQAANVINFNRHGSGQVAQLLVKTVPFMGAYANSIDVLFQALAGGGLKGMSRTKALRRLAVTGGLLATSTLIYCMLVGDDDEYQKLDDQTKMRNFIIPGTKIMLPMNTSAAYFFKAIPEMIYNKVMKEGTDTPVDNRRLRRALAEAARDMMLGPEPIPAAGKPFIEIGLNHSFFTGREITPVGLKDLEAAEQYTMTTSELGKLISGLAGTEKNRLLNPVEADHLVRSLFGSAGSMAQWASNVMGQAAGVRPDVQTKEYPLVGAFMRPEIPRGREDLFYDFKGEVEQAYKTMMVKAERLKDAELDKYIEQNQDLISMHDYVNEVDKAFKEINQAIRFYGTAVDKTISPKERRDEINELQKTRGEILEGIEKMRLQAGM